MASVFMTPTLHCSKKRQSPSKETDRERAPHVPPCVVACAISPNMTAQDYINTTSCTRCSVVEGCLSAVRADEHSHPAWYSPNRPRLDGNP